MGRLQKLSLISKMRQISTWKRELKRWLSPKWGVTNQYRRKEGPIKEFDYDPSSPNGPSNWANTWPLCRDGTRQSPINLFTANVVLGSGIQRNYQPANATLVTSEHDVMGSCFPSYSFISAYPRPLPCVSSQQRSFANNHAPRKIPPEQDRDIVPETPNTTVPVIVHRGTVSGNVWHRHLHSLLSPNLLWALTRCT
ncbi:uncharacterized protein HKW66_Vig0215970 [Vigna angularis]|uniref:Alpha-carbonic anhydrase domain-containing protein n=1 Tax=Phaseolus angularis TaxID=3914 RepID=A0A8T0JHI2_PHAAN|nr:uncharacterized protein HKW66_Vig0215970 [Vigna angularis]